MNTRTLRLFSFIIAIGLCEPAHSQETEDLITPAQVLRLNLATEDARQTETKIEIKTGGAPSKIMKTVEGVQTGSKEVLLSGIPDGDYFVYFSSPGYAAQWRTLALKQQKTEPDAMNVKLFRKRYVVLRYIFNTSGERELSGPDIKEERAAVAHWGSLPYFQQDWQIWQKSTGVDLFGKVPYLQFHRFSNGFGFADVPKGVSFDDLKEAPLPGDYQCISTKAEKGLMFFCRVEANRKEGLGYGKVLVEDVTDTPPVGVKVIE